jgi:hypothetical protein
MAVADMSPAYKDTVGPALKRTQNVMRRYRCGTHDSDGTNIGRICQSAYTCQISRPICTPVTHKSDDFRLKSILVHIFLLFNGLGAQCALDLGIKLIVVKTHQRGCFGRAYCCTGATPFAQCRVDYGHKLLTVKINGAIGTNIDAS